PLSIGIALAWPEPLAVGPRRAHWVRRAGAAAGSAIERIRLVESIAALRTQVRVLVDAGATLAREGDLPGALEGIVHLLRDRRVYRVCSPLVVDEEKNVLRCATMPGYADSFRDLPLPLDGTSVTATTARERRSVEVPDVSKWPGYVSGATDIRSE